MKSKILNQNPSSNNCPEIRWIYTDNTNGDEYFPANRIFFADEVR